MDNKIKIIQIKIEDIVKNWKKYNLNLPYQRDEDAWGSNVTSKLIDSIVNNYFIPPIILKSDEYESHYDVLDGKQRLSSIHKFYDEKIKISFDNKKKIGFPNFDKQNEFLQREIPAVILINESDEKIRETFLRINLCSIKLNKAEFILANANVKNRDWIKKLANNHNFRRICDKKTSDRRFNREYLLVWIVSILKIPKSNKCVRKYSEKILQNDIQDFDYFEEEKKFSKLFELFDSIFGESYNIPSKSFKTIFSSIFVALYNMWDSKSSFFSNKEQIRHEIEPVISEIAKDQMGGGVKFDSKEHIFKRIEKVENVLRKYAKDSKRTFDQEEKNEKLKESQYKCQKCGTTLNSSTAQADHIFPHSKGGKTEYDNLQILCEHCNKSKSNK